MYNLLCTGGCGFIGSNFINFIFDNSDYNIVNLDAMYYCASEDNIRSYIRKNQFLDEFDLITEIDLDKYEHAPGSALVFNSDSIVFMTNNQSLEAVGDWEYIEAEKPVVTSSKSKSKSGRGHGRDRDRRRDNSDDDDNNNYERNQSKYKTKEDDLPVNEIENIISEKFQEYNKTREFVIHESKGSFLVLIVKSAELVKV